MAREDVPKYRTRTVPRLEQFLLSLAAMQLMLVARSYGYDTNAIGGYKKDGLAKAFGLAEDRHVPVLLIALGKANEEGFESVRLDASDVTTFA